MCVARRHGRYAYGVYDGCGTDSVSLDHGVQLVGYGVDESAGPYWLVRNRCVV